MWVQALVPCLPCPTPRVGQGGRGRSKGGERPMGTTADGGKGSKGRAANGDQPVGAAGCRREQHTKGVMPTPPPPCTHSTLCTFCTTRTIPCCTVAVWSAMSSMFSKWPSPESATPWSSVASQKGLLEGSTPQPPPPLDPPTHLKQNALWPSLCAAGCAHSVSATAITRDGHAPPDAGRGPGVGEPGRSPAIVSGWDRCTAGQTDR